MRHLGITTEKLLTEDITALIGPGLQEAMTTAVKDFESALQCLLPRGAELRTLRTVIDAFIRGKLKLPPWDWLPLELHVLFVREYISLLVGVEPQLRVDYSTRPTVVAQVDERLTIAPGIDQQAALRKLDAFVASIRDQIMGVADRRYRHPDAAKLMRNGEWLYRHRIRSESISSIANSLPSNSWATVQEALTEALRVLSLPILESFNSSPADPRN